MPPTVITSTTYNRYSPFNTFKAAFQRPGGKKHFTIYERPPFPIINERPLLSDVLKEIRFSDALFSGTWYMTFAFLAHKVSLRRQNIVERLINYHVIAHAGFVSACFFMVLFPFRRITGYDDNGLRWKHPENKFEKFDNTSEFMKRSVWKNIYTDIKG